MTYVVPFTKKKHSFKRVNITKFSFIFYRFAWLEHLAKREVRYLSRLYKQLDVTEPRRETDTFSEPCRKIRLLGPGWVMLATGKKRKKLRTRYE